MSQIHLPFYADGPAGGYQVPEDAKLQELLRPHRDFNYKHIAWSRPDAKWSPLCSYCFALSPVEHSKLILFSREGLAAKFCVGCVDHLFGKDALVLTGGKQPHR